MGPLTRADRANELRPVVSMAGMDAIRRGYERLNPQRELEKIEPPKPKRTATPKAPKTISVYMPAPSVNVSDFRDLTRSRESTIRAIIGVVCDHMGITFEDFMSKARCLGKARPRQVVCFICDKVYGYSPSRTARVMGVDHTTVLYNIERVPELMRGNAEFHETVVVLVNYIHELKTKAELEARQTLPAYQYPK
jgi:hypothetical protein